MRLAALLVLTACAPPVSQPIEPVPDPSDHRRVVLAAMLGAVERIEASGAEVSVDPRLSDLTADPGPSGVLRVGEVGHHLPGPEEDSAWNAARLEEEGIRLDPAFPFRANCTGLMVAPGHRVVTGCPSESIRILAFGLPEELDANRWSVPMWRVGYTAVGRVITTYELTVTEDDGGYALTGMEPVVVIE